MRIAFVVHNLVRGNGQGRIQYETALHCLREGHDVTLFADQVAPELVEQGATWSRVAQVPQRPNLIGAYRFAAGADRALSAARGRFDMTVAAGFTTRSAHDVSFCQFVHGAWIASPVHVSRLTRGPKSWYQRLYSRCNAKWERESYRSARVVVAPSEKIKRELEGIGVGPEKIAVIYNGVDLEEFKPGPADRRTLCLPEGVPLALFVGDIRTPRKNLDSVLKALSRVPAVHLAVVGALPGSPFPAMARRLGIADRVHFAGFRTDVPAYMRACDLFVFPSRYEAGTLVLMEALASGLPIVTARTAGGCEVMGGECGAIVEDPDDVGSLAASIHAFAADPAARARAARAARANALDHSWSKMAARYLDLFARLARPATRVAAPAPLASA